MTDDIYENYARIPSSERVSGVFSESSINRHHVILRAKFYKTTKRKIGISVANHLVSFVLIACVGVAVVRNVGGSWDDATLLIELLSHFWIVTFFCINGLRLYRYPTQSDAAHDLELIRAVEREITNPDFEA